MMEDVLLCHPLICSSDHLDLGSTLCLPIVAVKHLDSTAIQMVDVIVPDNR